MIETVVAGGPSYKAKFGIGHIMTDRVHHIHGLYYQAKNRIVRILSYLIFARALNTAWPNLRLLPSNNNNGVTSLPLDLLPLLSSFAIVALTEFGDKTQIAIISLSAEHKPRSVFVGAMLAFALIDGVCALIGGAIAPVIPVFWISLVAGIVFIVFGIYTLLRKEDGVTKIKERSKVVTTSFLLVTALEFGDKTQLAVIALAAEYDAPLQVFVGAMLALTLLTALESTLGSFVSRYISARYIKIGASLIFIVFGILFLLETISGTKLF